MKIEIGTFGFKLILTPTIPDKYARIIAQKEAGGFPITENFGELPEFRVKDLQDLGFRQFDHLNPSTHMVFVPKGSAFAIMAQFPWHLVAGFAVQDVNVRTGLPETIHITTDGIQSVFSYPTRQSLRIDGYVHVQNGRANQVLQFRMLEDGLQHLGVAKQVGIPADSPFVGTISMQVYTRKDGEGLIEGATLPRNSYLRQTRGHGNYRGGGGHSFRGSRNEESVASVGAGAPLSQKHPDNPNFNKEDFREAPLMTINMGLFNDLDLLEEIAERMVVKPGYDAYHHQKLQEKFEQELYNVFGGDGHSNNMSGIRPTWG